MNKEELKKHCEKQIELCLALNDYRHVKEHQAVLDILEENQKYKEVIDKVKDKLYCWGEVLDPDFQKQMLDILKEVE